MKRKQSSTGTKNRKGSDVTSAVRSERAAQKSAAEFFSEHQQIAGFDNPGKSLFTTIRELVENSLDAAEAIHVLPEVKVKVKEYSEANHNSRHGIKKKTSSVTSVSSVLIDSEDLSQNISNTQTSSTDADILTQDPSTVSSGTGSKKSRKAGVNSESKELMYYEITVEDNGCGIKEKDISHLLGKVLSGSKHGVRQTRGKFGLGSKMALIWSKKSSGLPIKIRTAHCPTAHGTPSPITEMVLDIDIQRNEPNVISNTQEVNSEGWRGVKFSITIGGNWSSYRSRVLQYFQQLAVITPYAYLSLEFEAAKDSKKNFTAEFVHRSDQMPPIATVVLPHPKSLNNITLSSLLTVSKSTTLSHFLAHELSSLSPKSIKDILENLNLKDTSLRDIKSSHIAALCQILRDDTTIKPPSSNCLSPAGEYNMRLGVLKELKPRLVSTYTDKPGAHEGHAFLVEAAISLGGESVKEGINIFRFANRIPMLFETGADVVTQVATKRIKWSSYLIDPKKDAIGVYVSIVSTRIPFKGTSKEYIGDDVLEIQHSVKRALIGCCQQMKGQLAESIAKKNIFEKNKTLLKYIPDVSRSLMGVMHHIKSHDKVSEKNKRLFDQIDTISTKFNEIESKGARKKTKKDITEYSEKLLIEPLTAAVNKACSEEEIGQDAGEDTSCGIAKSGKKTSSNAKTAVKLLLKLNSSEARHIDINLVDSKDNVEIQQGDGNVNIVDLSQEFSLSQDSLSSKVAATGRWMNIKGELQGKVWVSYKDSDIVPAYEIVK